MASLVDKPSSMALTEVDWGTLFCLYDTSRNGNMSATEFTFLVKDLMHLRDDSISSIEDAIALAKQIAADPAWGGRTKLITADKLENVAKLGVFNRYGFTAKYFKILCRMEGVEPSPMKKSQKPILDEQSSRSVVQAAMNRVSATALSRQTSSNSREPEYEGYNPDSPLFVGLGSGGSMSFTPEDSLLELSSSSNSNPNINMNRKVDTSVPVSVPVSASAVCGLCFEDFPVPELWGGGVMLKKCACDVHVCVDCLRNHASVQIRDRQRPCCVQPSRQCGVPLDQSLVGQLYENRCPLCDIEGSPDAPLMDVGCALDSFHTFCRACLRARVTLALRQQTLPCCPRSAECKFDLDEDALRKIFGVDAATDESPVPGEQAGLLVQDAQLDVDQVIEMWFRCRMQTVQSSFRGAKPCPMPDCPGFLNSTLEAANLHRGRCFEIQCSVCHLPHCWSCRSDLHPNRSCSDMARVSDQWARFLGDLVSATTDSSGSGSSSSSSGGADDDAVALAVARLENSVADRKYFELLVTEGRMKRCPHCKKLIEKAPNTCSDMVRDKPKHSTVLYCIVFYLVVRSQR